jgi:phosphoadenosine phosphosulfate reductase
MIEALLQQPKKPILFFSGGKDSLATLLLLRPYWDRLQVAWANPGAPHFETEEYMRYIAGWVPNFVEIKGDQPNWVRAHGWPADVVPIRTSDAGQVGAGPADMKFQPYTDCCWANMGRPMFDYVREHGSTLVIMGQRHDEKLRNRMRDGVLQTVDGVQYYQPINDWSASRVLEYIESQGERLPPFYEQGAESSADCWNCTAFLDHNGARIKYLKQAQPEKYAVIETVLSAMASKLAQETAPLFKILGD